MKIKTVAFVSLAAIAAVAETVKVADCVRSADLDVWAAADAKFCMTVMDDVFKAAGLEAERVAFGADGLFVETNVDVICSAFRAPSLQEDYAFPLQPLSRMHYALYAAPERAMSMMSTKISEWPRMRVGYSPVSQGDCGDRQRYFDSATHERGRGAGAAQRRHRRAVPVHPLREASGGARRGRADRRAQRVLRRAEGPPRPDAEAVQGLPRVLHRPYRPDRRAARGAAGHPEAPEARARGRVHARRPLQRDAGRREVRLARDVDEVALQRHAVDARLRVRRIRRKHRRREKRTARPDRRPRLRRLAPQRLPLSAHTHRDAARVPLDASGEKPVQGRGAVHLEGHARGHARRHHQRAARQAPVRPRGPRRQVPRVRDRQRDGEGVLRGRDRRLHRRGDARPRERGGAAPLRLASDVHLHHHEADGPLQRAGAGCATTSPSTCA